MIEDFSPGVCGVVERFHEETGKRVGIIATEHLDVVDDHLLSYAEPLFAQKLDRAYITHDERVRRFAGLARALHSSRYIFTLGDYPRLQGIGSVFPRCPIVPLPFPPLVMRSVAPRALRSSTHDFVFTGSVTPLRQNVLSGLEPDFSIVVGRMGANLVRRARNYWSASMALNIPQYAEWIWSSPMRILYGLTAGRLTVSPRFPLQSLIDAFTLTVESLTAECLREVALRHTPEDNLKTIEAYQAFAEDHVAKSRFVDILHEWSLVEGLA